MLIIRKANRLFSVVLFFCLIFSTTIYALSDEGQEVSPADKQKIFDKLKELSKDTYAIIATVNQEKQLVMLKEKICVDGTVIMKNQICSDGKWLVPANLSRLLMVKK